MKYALLTSGYNALVWSFESSRADDQPAVIYGSVFLGQPGVLFIDRNKSSVRPSEYAFRVSGW
jgi:hypothetical protein